MVYYNSSPGPGMLKHVAVSPHRARADSVSLASSASCCSLGSLEHRHDSVTDLSHRTACARVPFVSNNVLYVYGIMIAF
uniref:SFRICE_034055 n=1 Tax=Spodoptera frugiperda TaxID=7108 RepID=A0A2H1VBS4_SPOFR